MSNLWSIVPVVALSISLAACGDTPSTASSGAPSASSAPSAHASSSPKPSAASSASAAPSATPSATPSASAEVPPPFDGKLTIAQIMYGGTKVHPFDAWPDAMKTLEALVGKPTETHKENYCWAAQEGDRCAYFCIEQTTFEALKRDKKGPAVGSTDNPQAFGPDGPSGNLEACHKYLGKGAKK